MRILMLLAILMVSFSAAATEPIEVFQYEEIKATMSDPIVIAVEAIRLERMYSVTGETTQSVQYEEIKCYKPVYRVGVSAPVEVGWQF